MEDTKSVQFRLCLLLEKDINIKWCKANFAYIPLYSWDPKQVVD
jgi:hypothetical protein